MRHSSSPACYLLAATAALWSSHRAGRGIRSPRARSAAPRAAARCHSLADAGHRDTPEPEECRGRHRSGRAPRPAHRGASRRRRCAVVLGRGFRAGAGQRSFHRGGCGAGGRGHRDSGTRRDRARLRTVDGNRGSVRLRATRRIARGEALCAGAVQVAPHVERDQPVVLRTERGPISASRVLTATNDANTGERVRLRDPASGATVVAVVTGLGVARDPNSQEQK